MLASHHRDGVTAGRSHHIRHRAAERDASNRSVPDAALVQRVLIALQGGGGVRPCHVSGRSQLQLVLAIVDGPRCVDWMYVTICDEGIKGPDLSSLTQLTYLILLGRLSKPVFASSLFRVCKYCQAKHRDSNNDNINSIPPEKLPARGIKTAKCSKSL